MATEHKMNFDPEYFDLVKSLSPISQGVIFHKTKEVPGDDKSKDLIRIIRCNKAKTIFFKIMAPAELFDFSGEDLAFIDFAGFYKAMNTFSPAALVQKNNNVVITSNTGKINYRLSMPSSLYKAPKDICFDDISVSFNLSAETLAEVSKASDLVKAEFANIIYQNNLVTLRVFNSVHGHSFDKEFHPDFIADGISDFNFTIKSEILSRLPLDNYVVSIKEGGHIGFSVTRPNGINLLVLTCKIRNLENEVENAN